MSANPYVKKRLIKDILTEQGCVKDGVLRYIVEQDSKLYTKRKNVADSDQEIGTVVDSTPIFGYPAVGLSICLSKSIYERTYLDLIEDAKRRVWIGILQRLLADELYPSGVVHVWMEESECFVYVHGRCLVKDDKRNPHCLKYSFV